MIVLENIQKLYDGSGDTKTALRERVDVAIESGRILWVRPHGSGEAAAGPDVQRIDCTGKTVTPGIIDCHGHVTALGLSDADMAVMNGPAALVYVEKILHASLVDGGCTTMRDIGGATHRMKRMVDEGVMIGPRLKIAICMLSTTGGHADFRGPDRCHATLSKLWPDMPGRPSSIVDGPWECRKRVREIAACGADVIKICTSPGVASPSDHLEHQDFTAEEIRAICDEAHSRGLRVAAHAHSRSGIELAVEHGVYDIQHISFMDERMVERAAEKGCTVTPTSWVVNDLVEAQGLSPFVMEKVKKVAEVHRRAVQFAAAGGLKILAGTDPVLKGMHGRNYMEIVHLVRDGLSPLRAWWGATGLAAQEIGQDDTGVVAAGKRADLLICDRDVVDDPELLDRGAIVEVMKDGVGHRRGVAGLPQRAYPDTIAHVLGRDAAGR